MALGALLSKITLLTLLPLCPRSIVVQEPFLWQGSVRENLDPEVVCDEAQIWAALASVEMSDVVAALPGKLDAPVADEESFSKGQRCAFPLL